MSILLMRKLRPTWTMGRTSYSPELPSFVTRKASRKQKNQNSAMKLRRMWSPGQSRAWGEEVLEGSGVSCDCFCSAAGCVVFNLSSQKAALQII